MEKECSIGFIGMGNMATAIIMGVLQKGHLPASKVIGSRRSKHELDHIQEMLGIKVTTNNVKVVDSALYIVLAVKPQFLEGVLHEIKEHITEEHVIITLSPGKKMKWFQERIGQETKIIRCMPNTPALVLEGCTGYCYSERVTEMELMKFEEVFHSIGKLYKVKENLMDAVVGVSGSSPAYVYMMIEAMADGAVRAGMPRAMAYEMAAQAVYGSAKMVLEQGKHPGELKDQVCSPAGTTIEAVASLEQTGFRSSIIEAMDACIKKSESL